VYLSKTHAFSNDRKSWRTYRRITVCVYARRARRKLTQPKCRRRSWFRDVRLTAISFVRADERGKKGRGNDQRSIAEIFDRSVRSAHAKIPFLDFLDLYHTVYTSGVIPSLPLLLSARSAPFFTITRRKMREGPTGIQGIPHLGTVGKHRKSATVLHL